MSEYAFDARRGQLTVSWTEARGRTCLEVAGADCVDDPDHPAVYELVERLNVLAGHIWQVYAQPEIDALDDEAEFVRRKSAAEALQQVAALVLEPRRPEDDGMIIVSYIAVDELANSVGRALDRLPNHWRRAVAEDLVAETAAAQAADLGDYSGRAVQAVWGDRLECPPQAFTAAVATLLDQVDSFRDLPGRVGGFAACAASSVLLQAAARVAAQTAGGSPAHVFVAADDIEACSVEVPSAVVEALEGGEAPGAVVSRLLTEALMVRAGHIPDVGKLLVDVDRLRRRAAQFPQDPTLLDALLRDYRLSLLDPGRPLVDLWEHLGDGLGGAFALYAEESLYADLDATDSYDGADEEQDPELDDENAESGYEALNQQWWQEVAAVFAELVHELEP